MLDERAAARTARDWAASDRLRDELLARGIAIEDTRDGQRWRRLWRWAVADRPPDDRRRGAARGAMARGAMARGATGRVGTGPAGRVGRRAVSREGARGATPGLASGDRAATDPRATRVPATEDRDGTGRRGDLASTGRRSDGPPFDRRPIRSARTAGPVPALRSAARPGGPRGPGGPGGGHGGPPGAWRPSGPRPDRGSRPGPDDRFGPGPRQRPWDDRNADERHDRPRDEPRVLRRSGRRPTARLRRPAGLPATPRWTAGSAPVHRTARWRRPRSTVPAVVRRGDPRRGGPPRGMALPSPEALGPDEELVAGRRPVEEAFVARRPAHPAARRPPAPRRPREARASCHEPADPDRGGRGRLPDGARRVRRPPGRRARRGAAAVRQPRRRPRARHRTGRAAVHPRARLARGPAERRHAPAQRGSRRRPRGALPDPSAGAAQPVRGKGLGRRGRASPAVPGRRPAGALERPPRARPPDRRRRGRCPDDRPTERPARPAGDRRRAARARA